MALSFTQNSSVSSGGKSPTAASATHGGAASCDKLRGEILEIARLPKLLTAERLNQVESAAQMMEENDLMELKKVLEKIRDAQIEEMKKQMEMHTALGAAHLEWRTQKARTALQAAESVQTAADMAAAEESLNF